MKGSGYSFYIKTLYLNAGKSIMDRIFSIFAPYVNCRRTDCIVKHTALSPTDTDFSVNDIYFAFFHKLCLLLAGTIYPKDTVYLIMSPYHHTDVIYQMIIPGKNSVFTNSAHKNKCKDLCLYTVDGDEKYDDYLIFANNLFKKSEKIQQ